MKGDAKKSCELKIEGDTKAKGKGGIEVDISLVIIKRRKDKKLKDKVEGDAKVKGYKDAKS